MVVALAACSSPEDHAVDALKQRITDSANEPDSVKFRNVHVAGEPPRRWICGEVNGRNQMGGFTGFKRFVSMIGTDRIDIDPGPGFTTMSQLRLETFEWTWRTAKCTATVGLD